MSKEIYISSTPHETRLAVVENDQLAEIYYERENEYTLAGSIYNGKVTRVLPGMQSSFVDIGLERDAFLYVTDFLEEGMDTSEFDTAAPQGGGGGAQRSERSGRDRGGRSGGRNRNRGEQRAEGTDAPQGEVSAEGEGSDENIGEGAPGADGSRRWRGRRGRRRGRGDRPQGEQTQGQQSTEGGEPDLEHHAEGVSADNEFETDAPREERSRDDRGGRNDRNDRGRGRGDRDRGSRPRRDDSYGQDSGTEFAAKPVEPFILPGESLSRYRAQDGGKTDLQASAAPHAQPSNIIAEPLKGWDGGAVLPGESRSVRSDAPRREQQPRNDRNDQPRRESRHDEPRHEQPRQNNNEQSAASQNNEPQGDRNERGGRNRRRRGRGGRDRNRGERENAPVVAGAPVEHEEQLRSTEPDFEHHADGRPVETVEFEEVQTEYEPVEASASHRVDVGAPSEYRQSVLEEEEMVEEEVVEETASVEPTVAETGITEQGIAEQIHGVHEYTTIQPNGEMLDQGTMAHLTEIDPKKAAHSVPYTEHAGEAAPAVEEQQVHDPRSFAPGSGELEEELIDEDEIEGGAFSMMAEDDDFEEIEEETVEGAEALGAILRDMSIDDLTGLEPDTEEEETVEEGFAEDDEDIDPEESFDEEGSSEETTTADGTAPQRERRGRRDGRRGGRRDGGRDSRDSRGRGRGGPRRSHAPQGPLPVISDLLKPGQEILVQIAKEPIAKKGARITSHIALPGRFLVFMPTVNHIGVSRKISSDEERRRLKQVLLSEKGEASGGFIVRTAADNASEEELRADLRFLINLWSGIKERSESSKSPALIYHDLNLVERILRDQVTDNFSAIWVDSEPEYERVLRFLQRFQPSLIRRVKLYSKETPLFEQFGITEEINKALRSKVWLKSGGSIVINQTEALVAIDINTGKYVGKTARLEDTILKTNLDAIPEIVRQIRLRDLGGIIVIDFIDMDERKNRNKVMQALEDELKSDRAPSKVLQFNDFGLVAITRKRVKQSLERTLSTTCNVCQGTGMVKAPVTVCNEIFIEMRKMHKHLDRGDIMLRVHPEVVKQLKSGGAKWLSEMEELAGKTILVKSDPALHPEQFDIH